MPVYEQCKTKRARASCISKCPLSLHRTSTKSFQRISNLRLTMFLISLAIALTFSPFIVLGDIVPITDAFDICQNESLTLIFYEHISFDKNTIDAPMIRCLKLGFRYANFEEGAFKHLPNLQYLDLQHNQIYANDLFSFGTLPTVKILNLGYQKNYNKDTLIVRGIYPELWYLNLQYANIYDIRITSFDPFPKLTYLDLSGNRIKTSDLEVFPDTLTFLNLTDNYISELSLSKFSNLTSLILDNNMLKVIGSSYNLDLSGLQKLQNLSLANNQITMISVKDLTNLRYLNFARNSLKDIDYTEFQSMTLLETLVLDQNLFEVVPIMSLNITTLSLNCNDINHLNASTFSGLPNLRKLYLNGNKIEDIDVDTFENQRQLQELQLADNRLTYLPPYLTRSLWNIRYLVLSGNQFTSLNLSIYSTDSPIEELYLERNPIKYLQSSMFEEIPEHLKIYLNIGSESMQISCPHYTTYGYNTTTIYY